MSRAEAALAAPPAAAEPGDATVHAMVHATGNIARLPIGQALAAGAMSRRPAAAG
ncbi:hypothetical protein [Roseicella sp. DB1501]|uniref:hypothetical protein n=1 Tax=Roseicella sp. DB1501 TaxID=2730925 RepID=UPI001490A51F|nr:hypothetical protein [Roseicella sp. DB1501]NOG72275.1 hypothetical protein [Roseicella sp. DB1501]